MSEQSSQVVVGTSATLLVTADAKLTGTTVTIENPTGGQNVFIGPSTVTTGTGFLLVPGASFSADMSLGDALYGVVAATTQTVYVLRGGAP